MKIKVFRSERSKKFKKVLKKRGKNQWNKTKSRKTKKSNFVEFLTVTTQSLGNSKKSHAPTYLNSRRLLYHWQPSVCRWSC